MTPKKTLAGIATTTALIMGGVDASVLNETPIERVEIIANERVEAKQIGNVVETTLPWKGEAGIKVKYDMGEATTAEKLKDKRDKEVITELVDFGDGGFKVDILLDKKPDTNIFCYTIDGAENYDFFYQPPLTDEEIKEGNIRPPEIEGSYAVYHKTLKNHIEGRENYATGKVMHIPRPQVWEVDNKETTTEWADLSYENGQLCVTASQDFLDKAKYPVRIDPTFGYTTQGGSTAQFETVGRGRRFVAPEDGVITDISAIITAVSVPTQNVWLVVYNNTGYNMVDYTGITYTSGSPQTISNTATLSGAITNGTTYLLFISEPPSTAGTNSIYYDSNSSNTGLNDGTNYNAAGPENPLVPTTDPVANILISIYATYTTGGGGDPVSPGQSVFWMD